VTFLKTGIKDRRLVHPAVIPATSTSLLSTSSGSPAVYTRRRSRTVYREAGRGGYRTTVRDAEVPGWYTGTSSLLFSVYPGGLFSSSLSLFRTQR